MGSSGSTSIPPHRIVEINKKFNLIREIELEENKFINSFNNENENDFEGINLNYFTQYYLYPTKEETKFKYFNQIIMITGRNINPFNLKEKNNNIDIKNAISKSNEIITKYKDDIIPISSQINLNQCIFPNYYYAFYLNSNSYKNKIIDFKDCPPLIFILFNHKLIIEKIQEIKKYEKEKSNKKEEKFGLILLVKEDKEELKNLLISNNINDFYILTKKDKDFMELFGLNDINNSKCIFFNENSQIGLILEDNIEYLTEEMIEYYLRRNSCKKYNEYNNDNKRHLQIALEQPEFKNILGCFKKEFNLEIEFREIGDTKYPVNIRFKYYKIDKDYANLTIEELKNIMRINKMELYFISLLIEENEIEKLKKELEKELKEKKIKKRIRKRKK